MHAGNAASLSYGLPAVHAFSSNFGEFPQKSFQRDIPDTRYGLAPPGLLGRITFLAPVSTHLRSPRNWCSYSVPGLHWTSTALPSPAATVAPAWRALGCWARCGHVVLHPPNTQSEKLPVEEHKPRVLRTTNPTSSSLHAPDSLIHRSVSSSQQAVHPVWT